MSEPTGQGVIINADDFGLTPGVNRGIVSAFREGVLTSTTMMVNMRWFDEAVELARENADLPVGIHLTLLWGRPVSDPVAVPSLVDDQGRFPRSLGTLGRRYMLGRLEPEHLKVEFRAQINKFQQAGLRPTHLDTHKHVQCLPGVLRAMLAVAREFDIRCVRFPVEQELAIRTGDDALPGSCPARFLRLDRTAGSRESERPPWSSIPTLRSRLHPAPAEERPFRPPRASHPPTRIDSAP